MDLGLTVETINREAADKSKGFRLQKIRAIKLILETLENQDKAIFYAAIENCEDVSFDKVSGDDPGVYYEEDKNYDEAHKFTIFSGEVKNALVSFFDIYMKWRAGEEIRLGFYTTAKIGKERKCFIVDGTELHPPENPILVHLSSKNLTEEIIRRVKSVVLDEYSKTYSGKKQGHLLSLKEMSIRDFGKFLEKISWYFESEDDVKLKETVLSLIKDSRLYNFRIAGKEEVVFALLMELLEERQSAPSLASKVVNASDVKLIFKQAESEESDPLLDPTWEELKTIEKQIRDKRNLQEKIKAVCPEYRDKKLQHLARLACRSKTEQKSGNRSFLSLKYRVYEACNGYFLNSEPEIRSESDIDTILDELKKISKQQIIELKKDYVYTVSNSQTIEGIVMDLFDSCFVSFDEKVDGQ
jgi:hypothetical protein